MDGPLYHASKEHYRSGDVLATDGETSRYWKRLFRKGAIEEQNWVNVNHHVTPKNQTFLKEKYHFRSQSFKEMVFEIHRLKAYPEHPSRSRCRFLMRKPTDWADKLRSEENERVLYRVRALEEESSLRADAGWLGNNAAQYSAFQKWAE